jgi:hypothetical protein
VDYCQMQSDRPEVTPRSSIAAGLVRAARQFGAS